MRRFVHPRSATRRHQAGVGLIEVLIAVLVVSIGFLGVAALQVFSLSTNNSAMARSMASVASYSILDAIRVDRSNYASYSGQTVTAGACNLAKNASFAQVQLNQWCEELTNAHLGKSAKGTVTCAVAGGGTLINCTVKITFDDSDTGAGKLGAQTVITKASV